MALENTSLYLIPTPIGNLEDITLRALKVLKEVNLILAEDTRKSSILLKHYGIQKAMKSFHNFNEHQQLNGLIKRIIEGERMAMITDAGTPAIADPGFLIVRECIKNEICVECLPGPTALIPALVQSGFPTERFVFEGFLPHKKGKQSRLKRLIDEDRTMVFFESPHRLEKTLKQMLTYVGENRMVSISRELTKRFEETITCTLKEMINHFEGKKIKGEIVIVLQGK